MGEGAIRLADPWVLGLLLVVPVLRLLLRLRPLRRSTLRISSTAPLHNVWSSGRLRYGWVVSALRLLVVVLLVVALARPQIREASAWVPGQGVAIVLCFDVSASMLEQGLSGPTKLEAARQVFKDFIAQRMDDQVGLIAFENQSVVLSPLTLDYRALLQVMDGLKPGPDEDPSTTGVAIVDAVNLLRNATAKSKVIILATNEEITGNEQTVDPAIAAEQPYLPAVATSGELLQTLAADHADARTDDLDGCEHR